jgi:hypothetical protein
MELFKQSTIKTLSLHQFRRKHFQLLQRLAIHESNLGVLGCFEVRLNPPHSWEPGNLISQTGKVASVSGRLSLQ